MSQQKTSITNKATSNGVKNTPKKLFIISLTLAGLISFLFVLAANNKSGVEKFDIYLGAIWVFVLSFIVALSLSHMFKNDKQDKQKN